MSSSRGVIWDSSRAGRSRSCPLALARGDHHGRGKAGRHAGNRGGLDAGPGGRARCWSGIALPLRRPQGRADRPDGRRGDGQRPAVRGPRGLARGPALVRSRSAGDDPAPPLDGRPERRPTQSRTEHGSALRAGAQRDRRSRPRDRRDARDGRNARRLRPWPRTRGALRTGSRPSLRSRPGAMDANPDPLHREPDRERPLPAPHSRRLDARAPHDPDRLKHGFDLGLERVLDGLATMLPE